MHHAFKLNDAGYNVELSRGRGGHVLHYDGKLIPIGELQGLVVTRGDEVFIHLDGEAYQLTYEHPLERLAHAAGGATEDAIRAPMPGSLVVVHAKAGDKVTKGQALLVMESMKMETTLTATRDGTVAAVHFAPAQTFDRDALLLSLEPSPPLPAGAPHGRDGV